MKKSAPEIWTRTRFGVSGQDDGEQVRGGDAKEGQN